MTKSINEILEEYSNLPVSDTEREIYSYLCPHSERGPFGFLVQENIDKYEPRVQSILRNVDSVKKSLLTANRVCVFTGAGVSVESGIDTFRGSGPRSLWLNHRIEDVCTPDGFERDPSLVWRFYNSRRRELRKVKPNRGHLVIAEFEKRFHEFLLVTQNVDSLHSKAGNKKVVELHGNLSRTRCNSCSYSKNRQYEPAFPGTVPDDIKQIQCPKCESFVRPDVVWFEEMLPIEPFKEASVFVSRMKPGDVFFIIGTTMEVYPAASLPELAYKNGVSVVEINPVPSFYRTLVQTIPLSSGLGLTLVGGAE